MLINSGTIDYGLNMEEVPLVGEDVARVEGTNGIRTLQLDINHGDAAYHDLIDAQAEFNAATANADTFRITATFSVLMPNGTLIKYRMPKCTLHTATSAFSGSTERVTSPLSLSSQRLVRVS